MAEQINKTYQTHFLMLGMFDKRDCEPIKYDVEVVNASGSGGSEQNSVVVVVLVIDLIDLRLCERFLLQTSLRHVPNSSGPLSDAAVLTLHHSNKEQDDGKEAKAAAANCTTSTVVCSPFTEACSSSYNLVSQIHPRA